MKNLENKKYFVSIQFEVGSELFGFKKKETRESFVKDFKKTCPELCYVMIKADGEDEVVTPESRAA